MRGFVRASEYLIFFVFLVLLIFSSKHLNNIKTEKNMNKNPLIGENTFKEGGFLVFHTRKLLFGEVFVEK